MNQIPRASAPRVSGSLNKCRVSGHFIAGIALAFATSGAALADRSLDHKPPQDPAAIKAAAEANEKAASDKTILRICASANELPMSRNDGSGFENKIATAIAEAMGRTAKFVWFEKESIYLVRDQLDVKACDVVMGVDTGDPRVLTTKAYYRAPYVFILRKDSPLNVSGWDSPDLAKAAKIGFTPGSPPQVMMEKLGLFQDNFNYMHSLSNFKDKRNKFTRVPPDRMVAEVADGTADVAVNFAPEVARYVKDKGNVKMVTIPDNNVRDDGEKVPHHFDQSLGVRSDAAELQAELNAALEKARGKIDEILKEEGIPLLSQSPRS